MEIEQDEIGQVTVARLLDQRLDARSAPEFKEKLASIIRSGRTRIVLDLAEVEFVDSSGFGAMISILKTLGNHGDLVICGVRDSVLSMFKLTRLDKVFLIVSQPEDAIGALER